MSHKRIELRHFPSGRVLKDKKTVFKGIDELENELVAGALVIWQAIFSCPEHSPMLRKSEGPCSCRVALMPFCRDARAIAASLSDIGRIANDPIMEDVRRARAG